MVDRARADHRRRDHALRPADRVRAAGREPRRRRRSISRARSCGAPSARRSPPTDAGWLEPESLGRAVPQPARRSRARPSPGGRKATFRPVRAERASPRPLPSPLPETPEASVSLSFTVVVHCRRSVAADLLAVPVAAGPELGPGADAVDAAFGGGSPRSWRKPASRASRARPSPCPTGGRLRRRRRCSSGSAIRAELTVDGVRRAAAAIARRAGKVGLASPPRWPTPHPSSTPRRRAGRRRGRRARRLPVPRVQGRRARRRSSRRSR